MKIYFAGSIRGGRKNVTVYKAMISYLSDFGEVFTVHVGETSLSERGEDGPSDGCIYERDMKWLHAADILVAEVSVPSLGVGYEVGYAVALKKPVLCLYRAHSDRRLSAMIAGCPEIRAEEYGSLEEASHIIARFLKEEISI